VVITKQQDIQSVVNTLFGTETKFEIINLQPELVTIRVEEQQLHLHVGWILAEEMVRMFKEKK